MIQKTKGRPHTKRYKSVLEGGKALKRAAPTCNHCKEVGHTCKGCTNMPRD